MRTMDVAGGGMSALRFASANIYSQCMHESSIHAHLGAAEAVITTTTITIQRYH